MTVVELQELTQHFWCCEEERIDRQGGGDEVTNTRAIKEIKFIQEMGQDPELENH